jgi:hypothetical protein
MESRLLKLARHDCRVYVQQDHSDAARASAEAPAPGGMPRHGSRTGINFSTGNPARSIVPAKAHFGTDLEGRAIALPKHAGGVHQGTRLHTIRPGVAGGELVFFWHKKGGVVLRPRVRHPEGQRTRSPASPR